MNKLRIVTVLLLVGADLFLVYSNQQWRELAYKQSAAIDMAMAIVRSCPGALHTRYIP
jgi:hypothetical protein